MIQKQQVLGVNGAEHFTTNLNAHTINQIPAAGGCWMGGGDDMFTNWAARQRGKKKKYLAAAGDTTGTNTIKN